MRLYTGRDGEAGFLTDGDGTGLFTGDVDVARDFRQVEGEDGNGEGWRGLYYDW